MTILPNLPTDPSAPPLNGHHSKIVSGELAFLIALAPIQAITEGLIKSVSSMAQNAITTITTLEAGETTKLQADETAMETYANGGIIIPGYWEEREDGGQTWIPPVTELNKDSPDYGKNMLSLQNAYSDDKTSCTNNIDQETVKVTMATDTANSLMTSTSSNVSTNEQTLLNETSYEMDLVGSASILRG